MNEFSKVLFIKELGFWELSIGQNSVALCTHSCLVYNCYQRRQAEPSAFGGWVFTDEVVIE